MTNTYDLTRDEDSLVVCIKHGRHIPCRRDGDHHYTDDPLWVKKVRDFHADPESLTWEPAP